MKGRTCDISVNIAVRIRAERQGNRCSISYRSRNFSLLHGNEEWGPPSLVFSGYWGLLPEI
jgi:hypothetical protein